MANISLTHYKLSVYVPETHLESLKKALFEGGAGVLGNYEHACWQTHKVRGSFVPN